MTFPKNNPITFLEENMPNGLVMAQVLSRQVPGTCLVTDQFIGRFTIDKSNPDDQVVKIEALYPVRTDFINADPPTEVLATNFIEIHCPVEEIRAGRKISYYDIDKGIVQSEPRLSHTVATDDTAATIDGFFDASYDPGTHHFFAHEEMATFRDYLELNLAPVSSTYPLFIN